MGNLYNDLCESIGKEIDLVTTHTLNQKSTRNRIPMFVENLQDERLAFCRNGIEASPYYFILLFSYHMQAFNASYAAVNASKEEL